MVVHNIEIRAEWGGNRSPDLSARAIRELKGEIIDLQNSMAEIQTETVRTNLTRGQTIAYEWCVAWTNEELGQAVHAPMHKNQTYNAPLGMQPLADRFGAKAVPVETGVAIIGCAPAIADAVLQGLPQPAGRTHLPRRVSTYRTHCDHEMDVRLSSPSAGHDLSWIAATGGQVHPSTIAVALFDVLGEYPTTESVCSHPGTQAFEQMIQVTAPAHLRQRMLMGPGADGSIFIDGRNYRVYPFTEIKQQGRHRASGDTHPARLLGDALRSNPDSYTRTTIFAQVATTDICADEFERARSAPFMIPLGGGLWNATRQENGSTPAAYTMPTLGTQLALALRPEPQDGDRNASTGVAQDIANEAFRTVRTVADTEPWGEDDMHIHSRYAHGMGNIMIALAPGDMIITAVSNGGTISIRNACEVLQLSLTHRAWTAIRHPSQANLQAARHNIDSFVQIELEAVTGTVWHYQRKRQPNMRKVDSDEAAGSTERNTSATGENAWQRRLNENSNPQTEVPPNTTDGALSGPLQQLRHAQWERSIKNVPSVDNNPLAANVATEAAREALASFGAGAPADMIHALATGFASHVRARRATRAPNHWCWSITTVCWLIAKQCATTALIKDSAADPWLAALVRMQLACDKDPKWHGKQRARHAATHSTQARYRQGHKA